MSQKRPADATVQKVALVCVLLRTRGGDHDHRRVIGMQPHVSILAVNGEKAVSDQLGGRRGN
jgi:hypothetical protein